MRLEELMENPLVWTLLSFCTIAALIFAVFTWIKGKRRRIIKCVDSTFEIVRGGVNVIDGFKLLYNGVEIDNLTVTKFAIWNGGNETLNSSDVVKSKSLSISCSEDVTILDAKIIAENEKSNAFKIDLMDEKKIQITFDYIDPQNGVVVQVLHTGHSKDITVEMKIKGGKMSKQASKTMFLSPLQKLHGIPNRRRKVLFILVMIGSLVAGLIVVVSNLALLQILPKEISTYLFRPADGEYLCRSCCVSMDLTLICGLWFVHKKSGSNVPTQLRVYDKYDEL